MLRTCTTSTETALLSVDAYKALTKLTTTSDDIILQSFLNNATALIEGYLGYPLRRQVYSETVAGYGGNSLCMSRTPVWSIESIYFGTELVDPTSYTIESEEAGLIERELGWPWTAGLEYDLNPHVAPKSELKSYTVTYEAGYCMNGSTADGWLTTGEPVPGDLQSAILHATDFLYLNAGSDPSITRKRIGDLDIQYSGSNPTASGSVGLPDAVKGLLSHWRRF